MLTPAATGCQLRLHLGQEGLLFQHFPRAANHAKERVFRHVHRETRLLHQAPIEAAEERPAASEGDTVRHEITDEFRWRHFDR